MLEYQSKQKWKKKLYSRPVFFLLILLTIVTLRGAWNLYAKQSESEKNLIEVRRQVEELRNREAELVDGIRRLETPDGVEEEIRKKFSVVREGERMVVLVDEEASATPVVEKEKGFFRRMWEEVTGIFKDEE